MYSLLRLGLFVLALLGLWAAGMGSWLLVVVAALVAWALSYVLLGRWRTDAATWLAERAAARATGPRFSERVTAETEAEDAEADAAGAGDVVGPTGPAGTGPDADQEKGD